MWTHVMRVRKLGDEPHRQRDRHTVLLGVGQDGHADTGEGQPIDHGLEPEPATSMAPDQGSRRGLVPMPSP